MTYSKERSRPTATKYRAVHSNGTTVDTTGSRVQEYIGETAVTGGNAVLHWKAPPFVSKYSTYRLSDNKLMWTVTDEGGPLLINQVMSLIPPYTGTPPWESNNSFELIPFVADIDGTLAMFGKKFYQELSYGSVTWGVLPLISDIRSLANTVKELADGIKPVEETFEDVSPFSLSVQGNPGPNYVPEKWSLTGEHRLSGTMVYGFPPNLSDTALAPRRMANEFGVHLDARTVWDVIPLSFVVDYFLPIGDLLESLHPRGWLSYDQSFSGWSSTTFEWKGNFQIGNGLEKHVGGYEAQVSGYRRDRLRSYPVSMTGSDTPKFESPSFKELFNTAYLLRSGR